MTLYDVMVEQQLQKIPWAKKGVIDLGATVKKIIETFRLGDPENKLGYNKIKKEGSLIAYKECELVNS